MRLAGGLAAALLVTSIAGAAADAPGPADPVASLNNALLGAMKLGQKAGFASRAAALTPTIDAVFDLPGILRGAVGPRWNTISAAQQQALFAAFHAFTIASYASNFDNYDGQQIAIVPPARPVGADQIVQTNIVSDGKTDRIDYQMRQVDGTWKAEDVLLDGSISNVAVQRSDFRHLLADGDATKLIDSLNRRAAALATGSTE